MRGVAGLLSLTRLSISSEQPEGGASISGVWREAFQIHSYNVDFRKRATVEAICRAFLEAAWNHAEQLGFGYVSLSKRNKLWVLARLLVQIDFYPTWGERVSLTTWPRGVSGLFALRDFELFNAGEKRLAGGASSWLVLDSASHRPQRPDKVELEIPTQVTRAAAGREPAKLLLRESGSPVLTTTVGYSDIDVNHHVNSARYISWLLDSYSEEFHKDHVLRGLELNYTGETRWADTVSVLTKQLAPLEFAHAIVRADKSEVCRAQFRWAPENVISNDAKIP